MIDNATTDDPATDNDNLSMDTHNDYPNTEKLLSWLISRRRE